MIESVLVFSSDVFLFIGTVNDDSYLKLQKGIKPILIFNGSQKNIVRDYEIKTVDDKINVEIGRFQNSEESPIGIEEEFILITPNRYCS